MSEELTTDSEVCVVPDLRDPSCMFPILEELGSALMQNEWMQKNWPQHEAVRNLQAEAEKLLDDTVGLMLGIDVAADTVENGWAGAELARHLRRVLGSDFGITETMTDEETVRTALKAYTTELTLVTEHDESEREKGGQVPVHEYIEFMVAWSEVFSGEADILNLPESFLLYKSERAARS